MIKSRNTADYEISLRLMVGRELLYPLMTQVIQFPSLGASQDQGIDALIEAKIPGEQDLFRFAVQCKSRSTPDAFETALLKAEAAAAKFERRPLVLIPYLSPEKIQQLENRKASGIDLCGNGVIIVPGQVYIVRTGNPNAYKDSRPLSNPYQGKSSLVARVLLNKQHWTSLQEISAAIEIAGAKLSQPQISKAVHALEEERVIQRKNKTIISVDRVRLLRELAKDWRSNITKRSYFRVQDRKHWQANLANVEAWVVTGESSVTRYASFSEGGPIQIAVRDLAQVQALLQCQPESIPSFADLELIESTTDGYFFDNRLDEQGIRWASPLQTWLELQAGDARQKEAAQDIYKNLLQRLNDDRSDPNQVR